MKGNKLLVIRKGWIIVCAFLAVIAILAAFSPVENAKAAPAEIKAPMKIAAQQGGLDNAACLGCHGKPDVSATIGTDTFPVTIDPTLYDASVHGSNTLACTDCHADITEYPHPALTVQTRKEFSVKSSQVCQQCHQDQFTQQQDSIHYLAYSTGNLIAPTCTDCHNPHTQGYLRDKNGTLLEDGRVNIPTTCSKCHNEIYKQYTDSVHGKGVTLGGNTDTPTCTDCHNVHDIQAVDAAFKSSLSKYLCEMSHRQEIMDKYGISTDVNEHLCRDFHGTTVTIFEKTSPDQLTNKPVCIDCHGVHDITPTDDPTEWPAAQIEFIEDLSEMSPGCQCQFPGLLDEPL